MDLGEAGLIALFVFGVVIAIMCGIYILIKLFTKAVKSIELKNIK